MRILFVADIFGRPGRRALAKAASHVQGVSFTIANGENAAGGFGLTPSIFEQMLEVGVDVVTSGNHVWDKREIYPVLRDDPRLLRPHNYPGENPGSGVWTGLMGGVPGAVISLQGRVFMKPIECPFRTLDALLELDEVSAARIVVVDFHAEATAEKMAFGRYASGKVTAVLGTHTHVQSADARILNGGTAFITDAGMTGPHGGVIGVEAKGAIERFLKQTPNRFEVAKSRVRIQGVVLTVEPETGRATDIEPLDLAVE